MTINLTIDSERVANTIVEFIQRQVKERKKEGVVLGLSGGVDSSTVAFLAAKAMGDNPSKVHALYLPDRDSEEKFQNYAQEVAQQLGLTFKVISITEEAKGQDTYKPLIIKITHALPFINRLFVWVSNKITLFFLKKYPFVTILERGSSAKNFLTRSIYKMVLLAIEEGFNKRHRIRRKILEEYAKAHNLLLIGCANRSEAFVGWFVKDGVDDLPVEPILSLYKNQVYQLARYLGVPEKIIRERPSPDMWRGIGDEDIIGYSYEKIDKVAYVVEHGLNEEILLREGIKTKEIEGIKKLHQLSAWKRKNPHEFPNTEV